MFGHSTKLKTHRFLRINKYYVFLIALRTEICQRMGKRPLLSTSQNHLGNLPSWKTNGKHNFCICLLFLLLIAWPSTPGCPCYPVVCEREGGLLSRPYSMHEWDKAETHLGAGSRTQAWAIRRECGLVAAELGVDLTVTKSCTLVELEGQQEGGGGSSDWRWLGVMGTQKCTVLYGLTCTMSPFEGNFFVCSIFQNHFIRCSIAPLL